MSDLSERVPEVMNVADPQYRKFLYNLNLDQDVVNRLSNHLNFVYHGSDDVYTSPIAKEHNPDVILAEWDKIFEANKHKMNSTLLDLELSNRSKFGPRSIAVPWKDRKDGVYDYFGKHRPKQLLNSGLVKGNLRPLDPKTALTFLKNSTNSGLPYFTKKRNIKERLLRDYNELVAREDPCILFTRTQEQLKTRTVWGYPAIDTLREMTYYRPLLDYQKKLFWRSALLGPDQVDKAITSLITIAKRRGDLLLSIDFSAFDASITTELQNEAFSYIKSLFQSRYGDEIEVLFNRFNSIGILTPDGVIRGSHGVPSGSTFTNEVDSIIQYLCFRDTQLLNDEKDETFQIQGDDGVYVIKSSDRDMIYNAFKARGLKPNESKSYLSNDYAVYLQMLFHSDYRNDRGLIGGIYPSYRAIERILFQERWRLSLIHI